MEKNPIEQSSERLLLNAEPFGFGPAVAVASIFPYLRKRFKHIGFVGKGHTLDVQRQLPYNATFDISNLSPDKEEERLKELASRYDVFFTAMDFPLAKKMREFGMQKTCRYDALTWYWPELPESLGDNDLYIAQNFFGVEERLSQNVGSFSNTEIVPPLIPERQKKKKGEYVLVNFGGLQNPFLSLEQTTMYARKIFASLLMIIPPDEKIMVATSKAIAERIGSPKLIHTREQMREILAKSKYAFMTPGLGNIYDSAVYGVPTIWLPPANDSQGRQVELLQQNNVVDGGVDWSDIGPAIDYNDEQENILRQISAAVHEATLDLLMLNLKRELPKVQHFDGSRTSLLLDRFGVNGETKVAEIIYEFAEKPLSSLT
ncbi:MAG: hypothetical protein UR28_C0035G0016 [Candidatus Peregrinibacteria bacterium GW2011_GWF2_33_10]|nr:MAG: hypothetical protein UR28_C0035G0016 [Candidatus Peregrinibacteria bacterium GW2011_GWF2_33_10]OGJ46080.1 MAG: hypothetical protein A2263_00420 [Candidatus Peregrinibacteria bacterium RIFOXYA2_FULL_33_21]OGJ46893.1 MAG: hypothetical protein A2272_06785 [Candidatus Peregrinibacteria bacterium RIFOXYA12_FULL_33_12]OGJ51757.1 MAG: hypothetical protein A2307_05855 [Candidatus Peregrinibacteria bacterium RIFOXYB2_FULL_33_20]